MKKIASLILALSFTVGIQSRNAAAQSSGQVDRRGTVVVTGHAVKAVTAGPALLHGYSEIAGGAIFLARSVTGTDVDCSAALSGPGVPARIPLVADRIAQVSVGAGQIACLVTDTHRSFELLWHAFPASESATLLASRGR